MGQLRIGGSYGRKKRSRLRATIMATAMVCLGIGIFLTIWLMPGQGIAANPMLHNSDNVGTKYGTWGGGYNCSTCHADSPNIKRVKTTIVTPTGSRTVSFRRVVVYDHSSSGVLGDDLRTYKVNNSTNVCEVCHHNTLYHQYSSSKLPDKTHTEHKDFQKECIVCHSHGAGFLPPPPGTCTGCHGNPPVQISDIFTGIMGPSPPADAGAHGIHQITERMGCNACHNNYKHGQQGNDIMEFGFNIYSGSWPSFSGRVTTGTININNDPGITWPIGPGLPNLGTTVNRTPGAGATCSIYCHGDNWNYPSGYTRTGPISWANGPLGACSTSSCHGTTPAKPPTPVVLGNISTGAHKRHVGKNKYSCSACHDDYSAPHMVNGRVKWNLASQGLTATYKGFNTFSTSYLATTGAYGACANVYCHSNVQSGATGNQPANSYVTATWGGGVLACDGCHGGKKSNTTPIASGAHSKHISTYSITCSACHAKTVNAFSIISSQTLHANSNIDVDLHQTYGGSYGQTVNPPGNGYSTCSATYCHSNGAGAAVVVNWGAGGLSCTSCHNGNLASGSPMATGKHGKHVNNAAILGTNYGCVVCHAKTVSNDTTISSFANHVNLLMDYSGIKAGKSSTYNTGTGVCSATYCHTDGKGVPKSMAASGWNSATTLTCAGCHGSAAVPAFTSVAGEPNYANQGANQTLANNHQKHVTSVGATTCVYCHGTTVNASGAILNNSTTHINRRIDVIQGGGKTFTYVAAGKTCSSISCHGTGAPSIQWGATMPVDCSGCHGGNATATSILTTGRHTAHINNAGVIGDNFGCIECHAKTVTADRTLAAGTAHINTLVDYSGARAGKSSTYSAGNCSATYCHTDGKGTLISMVADNWNAGTTLNCSGCHGRDATPAFASVAGEPNYASAGGGVLRSNSHQSHTTKIVGYTGAASCDICHTNTVNTAGTAIKGGLFAHLNRIFDINFNTARGNATWNQGAKTCSNITCHGGQNSTWGDSSTAGCIVCHGNLSATHGVHIGDLLTSGSVTFYNFTGIRNSGTVYRIGCANCHPTDPAKHRNGVVDVTLNKSRTGVSFITTLNSLATADGINVANSGITGTTGTNVVCASSYCHSNGRIIPLIAGDFKATPNWYAAPMTVNRCGMCHDNPPQYAGQSHYVTASTLGNNGTAPYKDSGHMVGIHFKNNARGNNQNGFLGYSSSGNMAHGNSAVSTTISCYICHSGIVSPATIDTYAMNGTGSKFRCGSCHTASTRTKLQNGLIVNTALHINGVKNVVFPAITIKTKAQLNNAANALGWTRNGLYKDVASYDSADLSVSTWTSATKTCLTACHVNQPGITWGGALQCVSCHANQ